MDVVVIRDAGFQQSNNDKKKKERKTILRRCIQCGALWIAYSGITSLLSTSSSDIRWGMQQSSDPDAWIIITLVPLDARAGRAD